MAGSAAAWNKNLALNPYGGNVGIGTSSPNEKLDVNGAIQFRADTQGYATTTSVGMVDFYAGLSRMLSFGANGSTYGGFDFYQATQNNGAGRSAMRITSGGSVCIGSTSPLDASAKLNVSGYVYFGLIASGAGNSTLKYNTSTGLMSYDTSARAFKKDIVDLEYGLDSVLKMSSKKYKWKLNETEDLGFIADEMYQIIPEVVFLADNNINQTGLKDNEPMGINYDRLVPVLVKAIQELSQQNQELKERLDKAGL
jgi:hypothetical protein